MVEHPAFHVLQFLLFAPWCLRVFWGLPIDRSFVVAYLLSSGFCLSLLEFFPEAPEVALGAASLVLLAAVLGVRLGLWIRLVSALCLGGLALWSFEASGELPFFVSYSAMFWTLFSLAVMRSFGEGWSEARSVSVKALGALGVASALSALVLSWLPWGTSGIVIFLGVSFLSLGAFLRQTL